MKLEEIPDTVVNTKTKKEFKELLEIYKKAGWKWVSGSKIRLTKDVKRWDNYKEKTCIRAQNSVQYVGRWFYKENGYNIISLAKFKRLQGIEPKESKPTIKSTLTIEETITRIISVKDGERYLVLSFEGEKCTAYASNLPHKKTVEDWEFYAKAVLKIIKRIKK